MKIAVVTTFPNAHWKPYVYAMVDSFLTHWPSETEFFVQLDEDEGRDFVAAQLQAISDKYQRNVMIALDYEQEQKEFLQRNADKAKTEVGEDFRKHYVRFSHKVFAMDKVARESGADYLIWVDADILTNKQVTLEDLKILLPREGHIASYLGRQEWASETGFLAFDLKNGGKEFIKTWKDLYVADKPLTFAEQTDAFAFDVIRKQFEGVNKKEIFTNLSKDIAGRDVFEATILGEYMVHYKGPRKKEIKRLETEDTSNSMTGGVFDVNNMGIKTKNCIENDLIKENVTKNLRLIEKWLKVCKENEEEVALVSAGPSLSVDEIKPLYERGVKIVAVKHAMSTLLKAGIVPWACILLDPRPHVEDFVEDPHPDVIYFVASMVNPVVTKRLRERKCKIIGYHALVGAGEVDRIPLNHQGGRHVLVEGGSATATRVISILEALGFRKMHLFAYDCCYLQKPDLKLKKDNGRFKYEEVTLSVETWGGKSVKRTFWTEGQFLAQVQEMKKLYLPKPFIKFSVYGEGIIPWMHRHMEKYNRWLDYLEAKDAALGKNANDVNEFVNGIGEHSSAA